MIHRIQYILLGCMSQECLMSHVSGTGKRFENFGFLDGQTAIKISILVHDFFPSGCNINI